MRFFLHVVTRNESDRYFRDFLLWHSWIFDGVFIYDDQSTDSTVDIAKELGAKVQIRPDSIPSFLEHEGQFRSAAWEAMQDTFQPDEYDWIVALDADEFLVSNMVGYADPPLLPSFLTAACVYAEKQNSKSVILPIPEVFDRLDINDLYIRTDGFWQGLKQPRICKGDISFTFSDKKMACGAIPDTARDRASDQNCGLTILHFGYAREEDREKKYLRYSNLPGHNPVHIESIMRPPQMELWQGQVPGLKL